MRSGLKIVKAGVLPAYEGDLDLLTSPLMVSHPSTVYH